MAERALHCLLEGCSIRSTERLTGLNRNTIMRLLIVAGEHSARVMDARMRGLSSRYLQVDEIWTFVGKKRRVVREGDAPVAEAIRRRDELNTFIRLLTNKLQGRDLVEDAAQRENGRSQKQQHSV